MFGWINPIGCYFPVIISFEKCNQFSVFKSIWPSFMRTVFNNKITVFKRIKPITALCFTYRSISVNFLKLSIHFTSRFLRMKEKNQHFSQMAVIWHKIRHIKTKKSIWRLNKINYELKWFVFCMSKLGWRRFGYVKINQHLLLDPSIDNREITCAPKTSCSVNMKLWNSFCLKILYSRTHKIWKSR